MPRGTARTQLWPVSVLVAEAGFDILTLKRRALLASTGRPLKRVEAASVTSMKVFELTRQLVDIESVTPNEGEVCTFLENNLSDLASRFDGTVDRMPVEPGRDNLLARFGRPDVVLSTHMDTVPPFFPSREDQAHIWGRGACDTKGLMASMLVASEGLLEEGV